MPRLIPVTGGGAWPVNKILAVGRNYADHAREMNAPAEPVLFMKPRTALRLPGEPVALPRNRGAVHHEVELVVSLGGGGANLSEAQAAGLVRGYGLGLDLTLREVQAEAKAKGRPWETAKGFDGAFPVTPFIPAPAVTDPAALTFSLEDAGGEVRQRGCAGDMVLSVPRLLAYMSTWFTLEADDLVLTGTPAGVGPVTPGTRVRLRLDGHLESDIEFL